MKDYLVRPSMMMEARENGKGHNWFVELLIFALVFIVISIPTGIVTAIGMIIYLFSNSELVDLIKAGATNMENITEVTTRLMNNMPEWITVLMLFSEAITILGVIIYCRNIEKRKLSTLGFRKNKFATEYAKGLLIGFAIFSVAVLICVFTGSLKISGISPEFSLVLVVLYFVGYMVQGMAEEVLCRGYLLVSLSRRYSIPIAIMISSSVFALMHLGNSGVTVMAVINLILFSVFAGIIMIKQGNIWIVAGLHSMWNFVQGNLFGIQVSGLSKQNSILSSDLIQNKAVINGGTFGLEGGLAVTIVLLIGIGVVLYKSSKFKNLQEVENTITETVEAVESNKIII